jgi:hypothetical protein
MLRALQMAYLVILPHTARTRHLPQQVTDFASHDHRSSKRSLGLEHANNGAHRRAVMHHVFLFRVAVTPEH